MAATTETPAEPHSSVAVTATGNYPASHADLSNVAVHSQVHGHITVLWYAAVIMGVAVVLCTALIRSGNKAAPAAPATEEPMDVEAIANLEAA